MPQNPSSSDLNIKTAADQLARRAFIVSRLKSAGLFKQADLGGTLKGLGQSALGAFNSQPDMVRDGLIGAGVGGLGGAAIGAIRGHDDPDAPSPWSTGLTGALAGGAIGAGAGLAGSAAHKINTVSPDVTAQQEAEKALEGMQPGADSQMLNSVLPTAGRFIKSHPLTGVGGMLGGYRKWVQHANASPGNAANIRDPRLLQKILNTEGAGERFDLRSFKTNKAGIPEPAFSDFIAKDLANQPLANLARDMQHDSLFRGSEAGAGRLNSVMAEYLRTLGKGTKETPGANVRATGWRSYIPGIEQDAIKAEEHEGLMGKALGVGVPAAAGFVGDTVLPQVGNYLAGKPLYGTPAGSSLDIVAQLQQYAKAHPEWIQQARESGKYIPSGVSQ